MLKIENIHTSAKDEENTMLISPLHANIWS